MIISKIIHSILWMNFSDEKNIFMQKKDLVMSFLHDDFRKN